MKIKGINIIRISEKRILTVDRQKGFHYYDLRHGDNDWDLPVTIEKHVWGNYWGTLVTDKPFKQIKDANNDFINLTERRGQSLITLARN